ncbi:MAG TPA: GNAT family N-acetyltransferase [Polyangiaceae bacterium]|nr:GNAT family N-acetyltransferase [Polyangiaceae bacterium]
MSVRLLELSEVAEAARVLTSAFSGDPLLVWSCGARERAGMSASARMTATLWSRARSAYGYFEAGRLVASALYQKPGAHVSVLGALRAGLWRLPFRAGPLGTRRILYTFGVADRFKASLLAGEPHFYLDTLGVHADSARRGIGPRLLLESLSDLRQQRREPCFLLTHLPRNVALYRRLGFEVIGQCAVPKTPITFWGMRQAP